ncbi:hypothetical protein Syun_022140 [Stephania yunnanensis]|uniref:Uncharacterized protein n=1 Tax=Stephania yunnanensis TaxID=152371 RepID=A0AAP0NQA9_9MAGN
MQSSVIEVAELYGSEKSFVVEVQRALSGLHYTALRLMQNNSVNSESLRRMTTYKIRWTIDGSPKQFLLDHSGVKNGIRVFAPRLLSFTYRNHHAQCIHLEDVSSVVQASISLEFDWDVNHIVCGQRVSSSLEGLLNVKVLTLSSATVVLLFVASGLLGRLPAFPKLVRLYVSIVLGKDHFRALTCFVHNSHNLEFLSVKIPHRQLYKAALGNCFEIDDWGPIEYSIMAKHFECQGKSAYAYHADILKNHSREYYEAGLFSDVDSRSRGRSLKELEDAKKTGG